MSDFLIKAKRAIPAEFRMISGCEDKQTSADVSNVASFELPDPAGRAGGACSSAFLNVVYADNKKPDKDLSFQDVLTKMRTMLSQKGFEQIPQLSASRPMDIETNFDLTPDNFNGTKRAVLIGINYVGQSGELSGCHNDVLNMIQYLKDVHGFNESNMTVLLDDGVHIDPSRSNILDAYKKIVRESKAGDVAFLHYSGLHYDFLSELGHGGKVRDRNGDESDGHDETLIPVDYQRNGQIVDDDLLRTLVAPMASGVFATSMMDCCHSGTVLDLPYNFKADGNQTGMDPDSGFNFVDVVNATADSGVCGNCSVM